MVSGFCSQGDRNNGLGRLDLIDMHDRAVRASLVRARGEDSPVSTATW